MALGRMGEQALESSCERDVALGIKVQAKLVLKMSATKFYGTCNKVFIRCLIVCLNSALTEP